MHPGYDLKDPHYTHKTTKHPQSQVVWESFTYHGMDDLVFP